MDYHSTPPVLNVFADHSEVFFFDELLVDPVDWYGRFLSFVGLKLPFEVIVDLAQRGSIKGGINEHPAGNNQSNRTFTSELKAESLEMMDDVMRVWLPAVLLRRWPLALVLQSKDVSGRCAAANRMSFQA